MRKQRFESKAIHGLFQRTRCWGWIFLILLPFLSLIEPASASDRLSKLPDTLMRVKPGIVGIGTVLKTRRPPSVLRGSGFVVADGLHIITNAHVLPEKLNKKRKEILAVFAGSGRNTDVRRAEASAVDKAHDLALLKIEGTRLVPMRMADSRRVLEGEVYAFTGYPLGAVLGLYPATHRGMIAAITPIIIPLFHGSQINGNVVDSLKKPFFVFQLDATAFPGNSGSPLYHPETGDVIGIINMVFVKGKKESAISDPSGITYAIPGHHAEKLIRSVGLSP